MLLEASFKILGSRIEAKGCFGFPVFGLVRLVLRAFGGLGVFMV